MTLGLLSAIVRILLCGKVRRPIPRVGLAITVLSLHGSGREPSRSFHDVLVPHLVLGCRRTVPRPVGRGGSGPHSSSIARFRRCRHLQIQVLEQREDIVSSAERFVRHHREQTDRAISQAYARLASDAIAQATFHGLLHCALDSFEALYPSQHSRVDRGRRDGPDGDHIGSCGGSRMASSPAVSESLCERKAVIVVRFRHRSHGTLRSSRAGADVHTCAPRVRSPHAVGGLL